MEYLFLLYDDENRFHNMTEQEAGAMIGAYEAYSKDLEAAGAFVAGEPLDHSRFAKRIRVGDDGPQIQDGPFTDAKEQLGGFYRIKADDLDEAMDWAAKCPAALTGHIEIRPVWVIDG